MSETKIVNVEWLTDRYEDDIIKIYKDINMDLLSSQFAIFGYDQLDKILNSTGNIEFKNSLIENYGGGQSRFSIGATIAAFSGPKGPFVIPPDLIEYIRKEIPDAETLEVYTKHQPKTDEVFERGKEFFEGFIEQGYSTQAAYMLSGAVYVECGWRPQVFNKQEQGGVSSNVGTHGWIHCGEGSFGLTFWDSKKRIIEKLGLHQTTTPLYVYNPLTKSVNYNVIYNAKISNVADNYKPATLLNPNFGCLFQCNNEMWSKIMDAYLDRLGFGTLGNGPADTKKCKEYIMYDGEPMNSSEHNDDDHRLLYACYLFKAASGYKKNYESCTYYSEYKKEWMNTDQRRHNPDYIATNGFVKQLLIAWLLALYVNDTPLDEINVDEIIKY